MNGRLYDYNLGRFLSVDPFIQGVGNSQGLNPYSYILNNPLAGTDPTGYTIEGKHLAMREVYMAEGMDAIEAYDRVDTEIREATLAGYEFIDTVSDAAIPLKGLGKAALKEMIKSAIAKAKNIFKKKPEVNNGSDVNMKNADGDPSTIGKNSDQDMVDNLVQQRKDTNASGNATFAQGRDGDGNLTSVRESTIDGKSHAEAQVLKDLEGSPQPHTVAVDQTPCTDCTSRLNQAGVDKVIVPSKVSNPTGSPKTAARNAAEKGTKVTPREVKLDDETL